MSRHDDLKKELELWQHRLQLLKERQARQGVNIDPGLLVEIEDIEAVIRLREAELEELGGGEDSITPKSKLSDPGKLKRGVEDDRKGLLWGIDLSGLDLRQVDFRGIDLRRSNFSQANLRRANLREANLGAADLRKANLYRANLTEVKLIDANLGHADLSKANLERANLSGADLERANLREAKYNRQTIWPKDFDPVAAGAILED